MASKKILTSSFQLWPVLFAFNDCANVSRIVMMRWRSGKRSCLLWRTTDGESFWEFPARIDLSSDWSNMSLSQMFCVLITAYPSCLSFLNRFSMSCHHCLGFLFHHPFKQPSCNHVRLSQEVKQKDLHPKAKLAPHLASRAKAVPYQLLAFESIQLTHVGSSVL